MTQEVFLEKSTNSIFIKNVAGVVVNQLPNTVSEQTLLEKKADYLQNMVFLHAPVPYKAIPVFEDCIMHPNHGHTLLPMGSHPGAFGAIRKHHIHEGVDLYTHEDSPVHSMCEGKIVAIAPFTGALVAQPWWNNTFCVMVETLYGVINYGEILPANDIKVGMTIARGKMIGIVKPVLKTNKGRPMSMVHVERYTKGTDKFVSAWNLGEPKPAHLLDPTLLLMNAMMSH